MMEKFMKTQEYIALEEKHGAHNYHPLDIVIQHAEGVWVHDVEGNKYLDFLSAYSAVSQGHCHPRIYQALVEQAKKCTLTSRAFRNDQLALFYKELSELCGMEMALPMNSGAEAVETAIKTARKWGYEVKGCRTIKRRLLFAKGISTAHHYHHQFLDGSGLQKAFRPIDARVRICSFWRCGGPGKAITPNTVAFWWSPFKPKAAC
jgi:ornithine--oxo-acid transaminase